MAASVTTEALRELAGFRSQKGCAISVYLDLDPSTAPTIPDVKTKFKAMLAEAEKLAEGFQGPRECRVALRRDLARIKSWWDEEFDRDGTRGVAVFASSEDGFFHPLTLPAGVGDAVRIGHELYVAPLAPQVGRSDGALVAFVNRERGTLYRLRAGKLEEIADESSEQPGWHDQGGWSQANYQRHIEKLVHEHLRVVGGEIDRRVRRMGELQLVIVAPEEIRGELEAELSQEARAAIAGWASAEAHAGPHELLEVVGPLVDAGRAERERETLEQFRDELGRAARAAAGWDDVLRAASDARVAALLLTEGRTAPAWRCPTCGRAAGVPGDCPLDGTAMSGHDDAADLAVHQTVVHGGRVVTYGPGALLNAGDVGALLRF
jgi:peptide chain release factor subunit 1